MWVSVLVTLGELKTKGRTERETEVGWMDGWIEREEEDWKESVRVSG